MELIEVMLSVIYVFDSDKLIGRERARLRKSGKTIGDRDLLIASTCLRYDLTVLTDNKTEFEREESLNMF